ncbi:MAG: hypothetical protein BGO69_00835 [Bacteroidetes bacterium 46-16]|nr:MAG: hypothetical protein BGO69_00835 [Bacteroidetes bacterium 46-16]
MSDKRKVFNKAKELHYKLGGEKAQVPVTRIANELALTCDEVKEHLTMLKTLRLIKFYDDKTQEAVQVTKVGLSTKVG